MTNILRVQPDGKPPVDILPSGTMLPWLGPDQPADGAVDLLPLVLDRLRLDNRKHASRATSRAITLTEEALHWLWVRDGRLR